MKANYKYNELTEILRDIEYQTYLVFITHEEANFAPRQAKLSFICETMQINGLKKYPSMRKDAEKILISVSLKQRVRRASRRRKSDLLTTYL